MSEYVEQTGYTRDFTGDGSWAILSPIEQQIKDKIERVGTPLKNWNIRINYGIKTGYNEAFIIDGTKRDELIAQDPKSAEIIRPILRGRDIKKYGYQDSGLWLIYVPWHFPLHTDSSISGPSLLAENEFEKQYPAVYTHLLSYKIPLSLRNKAETGIRYEWYVLQRWGANYCEDFSKQKIAYNDITQRLSFCFVEEGIFFNNTVYFISENDNMEYLLAYLNSKLIDWYYKTLSVQLGEKAVRMFSIYVLEIPIPKPSPEIENQLIALIKNLQKNKRQGQETKLIEQEIDNLVYSSYKLTLEEKGVIDKYYTK